MQLTQYLVGKLHRKIVTGNTESEIIIFNNIL